MPPAHWTARSCRLITWWFAPASLALARLPEHQNSALALRDAFIALLVARATRWFLFGGRLSFALRFQTTPRMAGTLRAASRAAPVVSWPQVVCAPPPLAFARAFFYARFIFQTYWFDELSCAW